jgi:hypothetical protein
MNATEHERLAAAVAEGQRRALKKRTRDAWLMIGFLFIVLPIVLLALRAILIQSGLADV